MTDSSTYLQYASDAEHMKEYAEYQHRYSTQIRESDNVLLNLIRGLVKDRVEPVSVLDIGCSTGNLLLHLKRLMPGLKLSGGDMAEHVIAANRQNPALDGIRFEVMDVLQLGAEPRYDIVVANAMLCVLGEAEFDEALASIAQVTRPGGALLAFDWLHPWQQQLRITETTPGFPNGFTFHWRGYDRVSAAVLAAGFNEPEYRPFDIPIDLEKPVDTANLRSFTRRLDDGSRLSFRGALCQPWCHLVARKAG